MQRFLLTAVSLALLLTGCNREQQQAVSGTEPVPATPTYFETVPADSPYLYASLEPTPVEVIDYFIGKSQPMIDEAQAQLSSELARLESDGSEHALLGKAILAEFDGKLSREGLESLGFSMQANFLAYGYGPFPVVRIGIGDAGLIRETVSRVVAKTGHELPAESLNGTEFWRIAAEEMGVVIAVLEDHVVFSILPADLVDSRLPELLNQQQPAATLDVNAAIGALNADNGYTPHGSGYLDIGALSSLILDGNTPEALALQELAKFGEDALSVECRAEISSIAGQFKRLETGYTELSTQSIGFGVALDLEESLASQLAALTVAGIGFNQDPGGLASFALGFDLMQLREWIMQIAAARNANPYVCEHLQDLNQQFVQVQDQVNQPIPPFIGNFMGFRGRLDSVDMSTGEPTDVKGVFALATSNPEMLLGMAQMFLPSMAELTVTKNSDPVALPLAGLPVPEGIENPHIALSDNGLGISLGEGAEAGLNDFLSNNGSDTGTVLALGWDFGFYMDQVTGAMARGMTKSMDDIVEPDAMKFYADLIDRQYNEIRLTNQGVEASQIITFK